jgi:hypothetical protein
MGLRVWMLANAGSAAPLAGVFPPGARPREVAVIVFYICVGSAVAKLTSNGGTARGGPGGFFFDDAFAPVTIVFFGHDSIGCAGSSIGDTQSVWD